MQVLEALEDLEKYGFGFFFREAFHFLHVVVQVAVGAVLQAEYDIVFGFECVIQVNQVFVLNGEQNALLIL